MKTSQQRLKELEERKRNKEALRTKAKELWDLGYKCSDIGREIGKPESYIRYLLLRSAEIE